MGAGDGLQMGVHHRMVVGQTGAEQVGALLGQEHGAPLSHAQHLIRRGEDVRRPADVVGPDQLQGLGHGVPVDDVELLAQLLNGVLRRDLALRRGGVHPSGGGVGDGQLEGVVALVVQPAAEAGDGGLRHAALLRQLGDGHELGLLLVGHHIVGHPLLRAGELIVFTVDLFKDISKGHAGLLLHGSHCGTGLRPAWPGSGPASGRT